MLFRKGAKKELVLSVVSVGFSVGVLPSAYRLLDVTSMGAEAVMAWMFVAVGVFLVGLWCYIRAMSFPKNFLLRYGLGLLYCALGIVGGAFSLGAQAGSSESLLIGLGVFLVFASANLFHLALLWLDSRPSASASSGSQSAM